MKRVAFLQALVLVVLLTLSWFILLVVLGDRVRGDAEKGQSTEPASRVEPPAGSDVVEPVPSESLPERVAGAPEAPVPPPAWQAWLRLLEEAASPTEMRGILEQLREELFALPKDEAVRRLEAFLATGLDLRTGLAFEVGPGGRLRGAASLRAQLFDWLGQIDPERSAEWAVEELASLGTSLAPDVYVIHMRNYAWGSEGADTVGNAFLRKQFGRLVNHQPWIRNPSSAIAESMDVAVHTEAVEFLPELRELMRPGQPRMLRHASSLALERLVDRRPVEVLSSMLEEAARPTPTPKARSGYFARLDPGHPRAADIFDPYLASPGVDHGEAVLFLQAFPNLNQSLSWNLLSSNNSMTTREEAGARLRAALEHVRRWQADASMSQLADTLAETEHRLMRQLGQVPGP